MTAADYQKTHHSLLVPLLATFDELSAADKYRELAEAYGTFVKEHATTRFLALEPIPFKISDHLVTKYGSSSAFTTFTLRHTTWASDLKIALEAGPDAFADLLAKYESEIADIVSKTKKLS